MFDHVSIYLVAEFLPHVDLGILTRASKHHWRSLAALGIPQRSICCSPLNFGMWKALLGAQELRNALKQDKEYAERVVSICQHDYHLVVPSY